MAEFPELANADRVRAAVDGSAPVLHDYQKTHKVRGVPLLGRLELSDCTRLILYNVQGFTVAQVWTELRASLGELARSIVQIKRVSHLNRNPHMDLWVRKDVGSALISVIRQQNKKRLEGFGSIVRMARQQNVGPPPEGQRAGNETRSAAVQHWRVTLWQSWRERRLTPAKPIPPQKLRLNLTTVATWNINGFWSKNDEIKDLLVNEKVAVLALQETLVSRKHYPIQMDGYRVYQSAAEEDFRGVAMLVDKTLASYEVPHGLNWLIHVKVFGYSGWSGPTHILGVYLKSGGNHRRSRGDALERVKKIVCHAQRKDHDGRFVVLGDFNEEAPKVMKHLERGEGMNPLRPAHVVGSDLTRFPTRGGQRRSLDHVLLTENAAGRFRNARVHRQYNSSDHRPVLVRPKAKLPSVRPEKVRTSFDNKMIRLKGDLVANDNSWRKLMTRAFGEDFLDQGPEDDEVTRLVSDQAGSFIATFDKVCREHSVKKVHQQHAGPGFPRHLRTLLQVVKRYSAKYNKTAGTGRAPEELDVIRLSRAQQRFKKAKRAWQIRMKQKFYSQVADDFVAHDHKSVWNRLRSQVSPSSVMDTVNPVRNKEGVLQYHTEDIMAAMKKHYEDLLTYDPDGVSLNFEHWEGRDLGDPKPAIEGLGEELHWPEVLDTIRGMNRNTAPGKDGIHINVLKVMVSEECMAQVKKKNPAFSRPDNVRVDLPYKKLPKAPLTPLGKAFHALMKNIWRTGCIPSQWNEVHIVNLFKGGDPENTNNYRGISLISCAFKVLLGLMANRLSTASVECGLLSREQAGFRKREEAVAQSIALAEIVRRRFLEGKPTFGVFLDFKKAYDRVYHGLLFRVLEHNGVRGRFLQLIRNMYKETQYSVRVGDHLSETFSPSRGAKQGDPLSPILFIIFIDSCLSKGSSSGGVAVRGLQGEKCMGLMYADDVIALENSIEGVQKTLDGIWEWGQTDGMELGHNKCGVMLWPSTRPRLTRPRAPWILDFDDSDDSSLEDYEAEEMNELEFQHDHYIYALPDGTIPTVKTYKYLGITLDTRLGDPRKIVVGERSMEQEFAHLQAKKGMNQLHTLRPFLTDRFCPIPLKVALVRNLIYPSMLYGAEIIGFQKVHADPMQRVINTAAKWIVGLHRQNTVTDAFTLCYELGFPPVFQELCAMRARLAYKLDKAGEDGLQTWIKHLWDNPAEYPSRHLTWVTQTKRWLEGLKKDMHKYARITVRVDQELQVALPLQHKEAPLRHWAQIGKAMEMRDRSNQYSSRLQRTVRSALIGETEEGAPAEGPLFDPECGFLPTPWFPFIEREEMNKGRIIPPGRNRGELANVAYVRDVVLERMMNGQRTKGFNFYDRYYFGMTRNFIRTAVNRSDLAEGVRWLCLARTHAFPSVENAWQRIRRSGKQPVFARGVCPLCRAPVTSSMEWSHLLVDCNNHQVSLARDRHLEQGISHLRRTLVQNGNGNMVEYVSEMLGNDNQTGESGVVSIFLIGGLVRPPGTPDQDGWFNSYNLGFGGTKLLCPGFESFGFTYVASFFQNVAPLYLSALGGELYGDWSQTGSQSGSSRDSVVNQEHLWLEHDEDAPWELNANPVLPEAEESVPEGAQ